MTVCRRYAANHHEAEDIMQETFIRVFSNLHQFKFEGSFEGWITRIAANCAIQSTSNMSIQSALYIGKYLNDRFYLKTGLSLSSITVKENQIADSLAALRIKSQTFLDVPLIAGYALNRGKIKINVQAGLIFTMKTWQTGYRVSSIYKSTGLRSHASLSILYPASEKLSVLAEPYYIRQLTNMSSNPDFINIKIHQAGLSVGLRYTIPNRQHH